MLGREPSPLRDHIEPHELLEKEVCRIAIGSRANGLRLRLDQTFDGADGLALHLAQRDHQVAQGANHCRDMDIRCAHNVENCSRSGQLTECLDGIALGLGQFLSDHELTCIHAAIVPNPYCRGCTPKPDFLPSPQIQPSDDGVEIDGLDAAEGVVAAEEHVAPRHG